MTEPSHADLMARLAVLETRAGASEAHIGEIKTDLKALRRDLRGVLLSAAEAKGTWFGIGIGARLAFALIMATFGAGAVKTFEWIKQALS